MQTHKIAHLQITSRIKHQSIDRVGDDSYKLQHRMFFILCSRFYFLDSIVHKISYYLKFFFRDII